MKNFLKTNNLSNVRIMVTAAIFIAISIVCGKFLAFGSDSIRFSFENTPIILSGMLFGPSVGLFTGLVADLIGCVLRGYAINPILTLAAALMGFLSGIIFGSLKKHIKAATILSVVICHTVCSIIIKTVGLCVWFELPFLLTLASRAVNYLIVGTADAVVLLLIIKNKAFSKQISQITGVKNEL